MGSEFATLEAQARELSVLAAGRPESVDAERLADRLAQGRFVVSVVGEFKRGKSTLLNALIGSEVLPAGVLPLTAVVTELVYGEPGAVVEMLDGTRQPVEVGDVADYVTEERNPGNERRVARVEVRGRWPLLEPGLVLVDTPGVGSVHGHNTEVARAALAEADGAVLVMAADSPISAEERGMVRVLAARGAPTFFVLNKADRLTAGELDQVCRFVGEVLCDELGRKVDLYALSARAALPGRPSGEAGEGGEFDAFVSELQRFVADDLVTARIATARRELARLGGAVRDGVIIECAALDLEAAELIRQVQRFRGDAGRQRQGLEDDRALLVRDVDALAVETGRRLAAFAASAPAEHDARLAATAATAPRATLVDDLRAEVETAVRGSFEPFRDAEAERTQQSWEAIATQFRSRVQARVDAVRQAAAEVFAIPLPQSVVPAVSGERERFSYLFVHVGSVNEGFDRMAARLVPDRLARRRALARARRDLAGEFDKHAGRAHWDLTQRLDAVRRRLEAAMSDELDRAVEAILAATAKAEQLRDATDHERTEHAAGTQRLLGVATALANDDPDDLRRP